MTAGNECNGMKWINEGNEGRSQGRTAITVSFIHDFVSRIQFHFSECSENEWMKYNKQSEFNQSIHFFPWNVMELMNRGYYNSNYMTIIYKYKFML